MQLHSWTLHGIRIARQGLSDGYYRTETIESLLLSLSVLPGSEVWRWVCNLQVVLEPFFLYMAKMLASFQAEGKTPLTNLQLIILVMFGAMEEAAVFRR